MGGHGASRPGRFLNSRVCPLLCKYWSGMDGRNLSGNDSGCEAGIHLATMGEFSLPFAVAFGVPATAIILITVVGNFLVLCFKARVGKRQTTLLIWNLGLADFLVGVIVLPMGVSTVISRRWLFGRFLCRLWVCCDVIFCTASIVTLCIISVDRYIGVTRPLRYKVIVTKSKVVTAICLIWIFSVSILLATVKYHPSHCIPSEVCHVGNELKYVVHSVIVAFFIPALVTLGLYKKIYHIAKQRERGLATGMMVMMGENFLKMQQAMKSEQVQATQGGGEMMPVQLRMHCGGGSVVEQQQSLIRMHKRVAKTLGVVVTAFLVSWLPFFSLYLIGYHCGNCVPGFALDISTWMGYCNSMINPVIYAFTIDEFRDNVKKIFRPFLQIGRCGKPNAAPGWNQRSPLATKKEIRPAIYQNKLCSPSNNNLKAEERAETPSPQPQLAGIPRQKRAYSINRKTGDLVGVGSGRRLSMRRSRSTRPSGSRKESIVEEVGFLAPSPLDDISVVREPADLIRVLGARPSATPLAASLSAPLPDARPLMSAKAYCLLVDTKETNL